MTVMIEQVEPRRPSRREEEETNRTRWLSFEAAVELRGRIETELGWPHDLLAVERAWRGEDCGDCELLNGYRVVLACPFPDDRMPEPPMARVRHFDEARDFLKVAVLWGLVPLKVQDVAEVSEPLPVAAM